MWRRLYKEFKGTGELIESSGRKLLQQYPKCKDMNSLSAHLDGWLELVEDYGRTLVAYCPDQTRTMLIEILPDGLEDELDHPMNAHILTHVQIIEWCKARTTKSRNKALAAQKLKQVVPGKLNPLVTPSGSTEPVPEQPPAWAKPIINMVQQYDRAR